MLPDQEREQQLEQVCTACELNVHWRTGSERAGMSADPAPAALGQPSNQPACTRPHHTHHLATNKRAKPDTTSCRPAGGGTAQVAQGPAAVAPPLGQAQRAGGARAGCQDAAGKETGWAALCPACLRTGWESNMAVTMDQPEPDVRPSQTVWMPLTMHCCSALPPAGGAAAPCQGAAGHRAGECGGHAAAAAHRCGMGQEWQQGS